jgi:peptidoglycan hydrolase-like protein with peptidoglycan-binding domain
MQTPLMRGAEIAAMQAKLAALGYSVGEIDGVFGRKTEAAVMALQANAMKITTEDGVADESVLRLLGI